MKTLLELRTRLIFSGIILGMILSAVKCYAWWEVFLHPPEIEGGWEVTYEIMKAKDEEAEKEREREAERQREEEVRIQNSLKDLSEKLERQKQQEAWQRCLETGVI